MHGQTKLEATYRRADRGSSKPLDEESRVAVDERWRQIHAGFDFTEPEEFGRFAQAFLKRRYRRIDADQRRQKLCSCGSAMCNVLNGKLPVRLQPSWGWNQEPVTPRKARAWLNQHQGCQGMQDALSAWERGKKQTRRILREIISIAQSGSIPESPRSPSTAAVDEIDADNVPGYNPDDGDDEHQEPADSTDGASTSPEAES